MMRKGGSPWALSCGHSQVFHRAAGGRCSSWAKSLLAAASPARASSAVSSPLSQGCSTALVTETASLAHLAGGWAKEGEQFGRTPAFVLVGRQSRVAFGLPRGPGLRDGLVRSRFIFVELHNA